MQSMTGFGQADGSYGGYRIRIDMRSVNYRYAETIVRLPREWAALEDRIRKRVSASIERGRVEVHVHAERESDAVRQAVFDWSLADSYVEAARKLSERYGWSESIRLADLLALPEVVRFQESMDDRDADEIWNDALSELVEEALTQLVQMRSEEGKHLFADISRRLDALRSIHQAMKTVADDAARVIADRLLRRIDDLLGDRSDLDEQRLHMEVALMAEKANVDEELTRLESHFGQFSRTMTASGSIGRTLDFLLQEMNREANTVGSKAAQTELTEHVIRMKSELEKIREQVQNIQ